jgi:hypothetical protein
MKQAKELLIRSYNTCIETIQKLQSGTKEDKQVQINKYLKYIKDLEES